MHDPKTLSEGDGYLPLKVGMKRLLRKSDTGGDVHFST
jgi:hypothetical protein